jgi:hypothetical protein
MISLSCRKSAMRALSVVTAVSCSVAMLVASSAAADALDFSRPLDQGGTIGDYAGRVAANGRNQHVIAGDCMSACTLWLANPNTCVMSDAVLWFHAAQDKWARYAISNPWRTISREGNAAALKSYPPQVRAIVAPWLESPEYHTLTGVELAALGVPLCGSARTAAGF